MSKSPKPDRPAILIMAGGSGTRFWPWSRRSHPKQLLAIYSKKTLLQETWDRARRLTDSDRVFIGTNAQLKKAILKTHPAVGPENFIIEPEGRNTAPIIALAALRVREKFGNIPMVILSADHYIHPVTEFTRTIKQAIRVAADDRLVTIGIKPSRPETGYGYLKRGKKISENGWSIESFEEKPDLKTARRYIRSARYYWNAGIFIWNTETVLAGMDKHCPDILEPLTRHFPFSRAGQLKKAFALCRSESIDYALMEKAENIALVEASFEWDDVGAWPALDRLIDGDDHGNRSRGTNVYPFDAGDNLVLSKKELVCLLGVDNLVVVEDEDVLFIAHKDQIDKIKPMIADMSSKTGLRGYLN